MANTPNHDYNVPDEGTENWHQPLNENFEDFDADIEVRDTEANMGDYTAEAGRRFLATDTGVVYEGTSGGDWTASHVLGQITEADGETTIAFGTGSESVAGVSIDGNIEVSGTKHFVQAVETPAGDREVVYTATEAPTPRTETSGVARLADGRAEIDLEDHFGWVTDADEPLLVQTTPYAVESAGLAVVERSVDRLVIEDRDGTGEYEFSYTVSGTREGQADKTVVRVPDTDGEESAAFSFVRSPESPADD